MVETLRRSFRRRLLLRVLLLLPDHRCVVRSEAAKLSIHANGGFLVLTGMCHRAEVTNINGRWYGRALMEREVASFAEQLLLRGSALGELDHPAPDAPSFRRINRDNASHRLLDLWWEGNDLHATVQVLPTRAGELIRDVYLAGANIGIASRGWATLLANEQGVSVVGDDFELITFDAVPRPAFERQMEPLVTRCATLKIAELLSCRANWWWFHMTSPLPPAWPWDGTGQLHGDCLINGQHLTPVVELMRHDEAFCMRARCLLLIHARLRRQSPSEGLGSLPAQLLHHVITLAAHAEARECLGSFQSGFVAAAPSAGLRLCSRPAQFPPLGAEWAPLLQAAAMAQAQAQAEALDDGAALMDVDGELVCRCPTTGLLDRARRGAAALRGSVRAAMHALRVAPPTPGTGAQSSDEAFSLLAGGEDLDFAASDDASLVDADELEPAMLHLVLEDSGDERSDAGEWEAMRDDDTWDGDV